MRVERAIVLADVVVGYRRGTRKDGQSSVSIFRTERDHEERVSHVHGGRDVEMEDLGEPVVHDIDADHEHVSQTRRYRCPECDVEVVLDVAFNLRSLRA